MKLIPLFEGELRFDETTEVGFPTHGEDGDCWRTSRATVPFPASGCPASFGGRTTRAGAPTAPGFPASQVC